MPGVTVRNLDGSQATIRQQGFADLDRLVAVQIADELWRGHVVDQQDSAGFEGSDGLVDAVPLAGGRIREDQTPSVLFAEQVDPICRQYLDMVRQVERDGAGFIDHGVALLVRADAADVHFDGKDRLETAVNESGIAIVRCATAESDR